MLDQGLDWEKFVCCVLTELPAWLVVIQVQPKKKRSCKQKSAVYTFHNLL